MSRQSEGCTLANISYNTFIKSALPRLVCVCVCGGGGGYLHSLFGEAVIDFLSGPTCSRFSIRFIRGNEMRLSFTLFPICLDIPSANCLLLDFFSDSFRKC